MVHVTVEDLVPIQGRAGDARVCWGRHALNELGSGALSNRRS